MTDGAVGTRDAIMEATFEALSKHGYADLTIQTIADEFEKSKSLLYYHYETKDDLLGDFLEFLLDAFEAEADEGADPETRLWTVIELLLPPDIGEDEESRAYRSAIFELRMRARYDEQYATRFAATDERMTGTIEAILADGVEEGVFDADPETDAQLLLDAVFGASLRTVTVGTGGREALEPIEALIERLKA